MSPARASRSGGQVLPVLAVLLAPLAALVLAVAGAGRLVTDQLRLQAAVDAAAYSAAALQAEALNAAAVGNRTLVAHLAATAQVTALVSHFRAIDRLVETATTGTAVPFPPLALIPATLGTASRLGVAAATSLAQVIVPLAQTQDRLVSIAVESALVRADAELARVAEAVLSANAPGARLAPSSRIALRSRPLSHLIARTTGPDLPSVTTASLDRFTAGHRGRPPIARTWRIGAVAKDGTSAIRAGRGPRAADRVRIEAAGTGLASLEAAARAEEFGYIHPVPAWTFEHGKGPAPVRIEASLESWAGRRLRARAAAAAVYRRPGHPSETPTLFGPFWQPRLVPFETSPRDRTSRSHGSLRMGRRKP